MIENNIDYDQATFTIYGKPVGKSRHRSTILPNGKIHNYNTDENQRYEDLVRWEFKKQCPNIYFTGEIHVIMTAFYPIPKSWSKKKKEQALNWDMLPCVKPDLDNVSKIILDSLNKVAYDDDKQVISMHLHKAYGKEPKVVVSIAGNWAKV